MSRVRQFACADPGPFDQHCTEPRNHRHSCYDAGEDTSWNDRFPEDWQTETPHACDDLACPGVVTGSRTDSESDASPLESSAQQRTVPTTPEQP